ncbi:7283_t:CDS:2, partial [Racocetra persica]
KIMESCWHSDPDKRVKLNGGFGLSEFNLLIGKAEREEIKFPENKDTSILPTKINEQAIYSSQLLTPLISKALTLQSMKLNSNTITDIRMALKSNQTDDDSKAIEFDINKHE